MGKAFEEGPMGWRDDPAQVYNVIDDRWTEPRTVLTSLFPYTGVVGFSHSALFRSLESRN